MILRLSATGAAFLAAMGFLVDRRPGAALGFAFRHTTFFVTLFDMFGHALLPAGVARLVAAWHGGLRLVRAPVSQFSNAANVRAEAKTRSDLIGERSHSPARVPRRAPCGRARRQSR